MTTWWGRTRSIFAGHEYDWIQVEVPAGCTPWNFDTYADNWHPPVDVWLPHPPVRGRKRLI